MSEQPQCSEECSPRRQAEAEVSGGSQKPPLDGTIRIYPPVGGAHGAALADASRAFARGDFGAARRLARAAYGAGDASEAERAFAGEILSRTAIDPVAIIAGLASLVVFFAVALFLR